MDKLMHEVIIPNLGSQGKQTSRPAPRQRHIEGCVKSDESWVRGKAGGIIVLY